MYCVCLVLELFILSFRILISKEARSAIVPPKKPKTFMRHIHMIFPKFKIPLACSKGAILHLKSEWPVLRGVPLHGKRKCLSNCIKVPVSPCMWTHTQPQGGEAKNLLLANAKPFSDDHIHVKLPYQYGHSFIWTVTSLPHQRFQKKTYGLDKAQI